MNNSGAELSSYFLWSLVCFFLKKGMQFLIVQKHGSASKAVSGKKKIENESGWGWGWRFLFCFFLYQQSCGLLLFSSLHKTKLVIGFGCVPVLLCLTVKVNCKRKKTDGLLTLPT